MAFIPTISACLVDCTKIVITDTTGFYNVSSNPYGWNDNSTVWRNSLNNPYITDANISISLNDQPVATLNVIGTIQSAVFPSFELIQYLPLNSQGQYALQDGYYNIVYTLTDDNGNTYQNETQFMVYCNVACCVAKMAAKVAQELCQDCDSQAYDDFLLADGILQALKAVAESKGAAEFTKLLTKLQKLCTQTVGNCGCGCS